MASHAHLHIDGLYYRRDFVTGRKKSADPKQNVGVRLPKSWREKIRAIGSEQKFIEDAVFEKLEREGHFRITETV